jgi:integrase
MATLYKDPRSGTYVIQFFDHEGIRRTLRTGVTDRQGAEHIRWHIDNLLAARRAAIPLPAATAEWLGRIDAQFRAKLETLGLAEPRAERRVPTLGQLIDEFIEYQKPRVKAPTLDVLHYVVKRLLTCLPENTPIDQITPADADRAYQVFKAQLAQSTANKHISIVRSIFNFACEREYIAKNPFRHIRGLQAIGDSKRRQYIPTKQVRQLLEKIPDPELQLVIVLARWCGLRIPSEIQELRWRDILWKKNRIIVRSPKTEHHAGKGIRMPRLFGIVRRYLKALRRLRPDAGPDDHVFRPAVRCNPLWLIHLWCRRLGIKPWSKFFTNLRASCATDLIERYPNHVCLAWLGHTERVADTHYRMVTENYYRRSSKLTARKRKTTLRSADVELMQRALHQGRPGASIECTDQVGGSENCPENTPDRQSWTLVDKCPGVYRVQLKRLVGRFGLPQPLQGSARTGVERTPVGTESEVQSAIAVNVVSGDAHVVWFRAASQDVVHFPVRVFEPDHPLRVHHDDIQSLVAINVGKQDGVADLQGTVDLLNFELQRRRERFC